MIVAVRCQSLLAWLDEEILHLSPGCFALVMATGIISNALFFADYRDLSEALFAINVATFGWLLLATGVRFVRNRTAFAADLLDPNLVFAFFTLIAAADVLGAGLDLRGGHVAAVAFWLAALILWVALTYFSFGILILRKDGHHADIMRGGWLIAIVATESLVLLGSRLVEHFGALAPAAAMLIYMLWGIGLALYAIFIVLFANRIFFADLRPDHLTPILWVVMGAAAISANAGASLLLDPPPLPFLQSLRPFIGAMTMIVWAWATWWIPLLALFGLWKHGARKVPLTYTPLFWSLVFPLGMYALATYRLSLAADFPLMQLIPDVMIWVALAAWLASGVGLALTLSRSFRTHSQLGP